MNYACVIVGNSNSGKSTFIGKLIDEENPILSKEKLHEYSLTTNQGIITFTLCDNELVTKADCGLVFYDMAEEDSVHSVPGYIEVLKEQYGEIPIIICANKSDLGSADIFTTDIMKYRIIIISALIKDDCLRVLVDLTKLIKNPLIHDEEEFKNINLELL